MAAVPETIRASGDEADTLQTFATGGSLSEQESSGSDVLRAFADQVVRTPDAVAVTDEHGSLTFQELDDASTRLALRAQAAGAGRGQGVAVILDRDRYTAIALLATLKCGGVYIPVDARKGLERVAAILRQAPVSVLVTEAGFEGQLQIPAAIRVVAVGGETSGSDAAELRQVDATPADLACIAYSLDSDGLPKGQEISRADLAEQVQALKRAVTVSAADRWLGLAPTDLASGLAEVLLPLSVGATVSLAPHDVIMAGQELRNAVQVFRPTLLQVTADCWNRLIESGWQASADLKLLCGGEWVKPDLGSIRAVDVRRFSLLVSMHNGGTLPPVFCVHGPDGQVDPFRSLSGAMGDQQPFYALQAPGRDGRENSYPAIEATAAAYLAELREFQSQGPYYLAGYGGGGWIAFEMAKQLSQVGEQVAMLMLIDAYGPNMPRFETVEHWRQGSIRQGFGYIVRRIKAGARRRMAERAQARRIKHALRRTQVIPEDLRDEWMTKAFERVAGAYRPGVYTGPATLFLPHDVIAPRGALLKQFGWAGLVRAGVKVVQVPGVEISLSDDSALQALAGALRSCLEGARAAAPTPVTPTLVAPTQAAAPTP